MNPSPQQIQQTINTTFANLAGPEWERRHHILETKVLEMEGHTLHFTYKMFGGMPPGGYSLVFGLHGGGGCPKEKNDKQWENHKGLYTLPDGCIWFTPRSCEDVWNMWHLPYIDKMLDYIIQTFILCRQVNPNKVYITGYSAGGDGTYRLGPRMADRIAAACMCAGHPGETDMTSCRNIGFSIWVGQNDGAYDRNKLAGEYGEKLTQLKAEDGDPSSYDQLTVVPEGKAHWMDKAEMEGIHWTLNHQRNPFPQRVNWVQCNDVPKETFYWLKVKPDEAKPKAKLTAINQGNNTFTIESNDYSAVCIRFSDSMIDFNSPVNIFFNGQQVFSNFIQRQMHVLSTSIQERFDPTVIYSGEAYVQRP